MMRTKNILLTTNQKVPLGDLGANFPLGDLGANFPLGDLGALI